jgi:cardiolipin synthase (CMP-forming)
VKAFLRHVPNGLSALRLLAAPFCALFILEGRDVAAFVVFLAAGFSDALDGYLARTFSLTTRFGAWIDPAADKLLMLASFVTLTLVGAVPLWLTCVVIGRDLAIVCGVLVATALKAPLEVKPLMVGKASTVAQVIYIAGLLALMAANIHAPVPILAGEALVAAFAFASLIAYALVWFRALCSGRRASI